MRPEHKYCKLGRSKISAGKEHNLIYAQIYPKINKLNSTVTVHYSPAGKKGMKGDDDAASQCSLKRSFVLIDLENHTMRLFYA